MKDLQNSTQLNPTINLMLMRLSKKSVFTPKPPKGGFITYWISKSPPWGPDSYRDMGVIEKIDFFNSPT